MTTILAESVNNKVKTINYNGLKVKYTNCEISFFDKIEGEEIYNFTFKLNNKTVLKFQDTI